LDEENPMIRPIFTVREVTKHEGGSVSILMTPTYPMGANSKLWYEEPIGELTMTINRCEAATEAATELEPGMEFYLDFVRYDISELIKRVEDEARKMKPGKMKARKKKPSKGKANGG
jgi:hypothetical protein